MNPNKIIKESDYNTIASQSTIEDDARMAAIVEFGFEITSLQKLEDVLQSTVDKFITKLGYYSAVVFLNKPSEQKIYSMTYTDSQTNHAIIKLLNRSFKSLFVEYTQKTNFIVKSIIENKIIESSELGDFIVPVVGTQLADVFENSTGIKNIITVPIINGDKCLGSLLLTKKEALSFESDYNLIILFVQQLGTVLTKFSQNGELVHSPDEETAKISNPFDSSSI